MRNKNTDTQKLKSDLSILKLSLRLRLLAFSTLGLYVQKGLYCMFGFSVCYALRSLWGYWLLRPLIFATMSPMAMFFLVAFVGLIGNIANIVDTPDYTLRRYIKKSLAIVTNTFSYIYHGYEVRGIENLPRDKGCLIVYYHGFMPVDAMFLNGVFYGKHEIVIGGVVDKFFKALPMEEACAIGGYLFGGRDDIIDLLKKGNILTVAPGGTHEAFHSRDYGLCWKKRTGFAHAAKTANVPIVPMFTRNIREQSRSLTTAFPKLNSTMDFLYRSFGFPAVFPCGGLPVKLTTILGKPLHCGENESPEEFASRVKDALENLIREHQPLPGSMLRALRERIY